MFSIYFKDNAKKNRNMLEGITRQNMSAKLFEGGIPTENIV